MVRFFAFAIVVLCVVIVLLFYRGTGQYHVRKSLPGLDPALPIEGVPWSQQRAYVDARRCPCGGRLKSFGEGPRTHHGRELTAVVAECDRCEKSYEVFFAGGEAARAGKASGGNVVPFKRRGRS